MSEGNPNSSVNLSGDHVKKTIAGLTEAGKITPEQGELIFWLFAYVKGRDLSFKQAADQLKVDGSTVSRVLHGTYGNGGAKYDNICNKIENFKKLTEERAAAQKDIYVQTQVADIAHDVCYSATVTNSIAFLFGDTQIGKTTALRRYAEANKSKSVHYVRLPASSGVQLAAQEIAVACFISRKGCFAHLRERILHALNENSTLIIDELHQVFLSYQKTSAVKVFEFLREIHDRTGCGMVMCGTHVLKEEVEGGKLSMMLEQCRERGIIQVDLPKKPPMRDLYAIAAAFGLPKPKRGDKEYQLCSQIVREHSISHYVKYLQAASRMAARNHEALNWNHFIQAHAIIQRYAVVGK